LKLQIVFNQTSSPLEKLSLIPLALEKVFKNLSLFLVARSIMMLFTESIEYINPLVKKGLHYFILISDVKTRTFEGDWLIYGL